LTVEVGYKLIKKFTLLFISIYANFNVNPAINGTEAYIYRYYTQANRLVQHVLNEVVATAGTKNNLVEANPTLYVLRYTKMPAILVELTYLSNPSDREKTGQRTIPVCTGNLRGYFKLFRFRLKGLIHAYPFHIFPTLNDFANIKHGVDKVPVLGERPHDIPVTGPQ